MPSSELSDALNPHIAYSRTRTLPYAQHVQPVEHITAQEASHSTFVPHRSELEYAICEPPLPPPRPKPDGAQVIQHLARTLAAMKEAHETERRRRLAWEQELEAKYAHRHMAMETQVAEMRQEIACLRGIISALPPSHSQGPNVLQQSPLLVSSGPSPPAMAVSPPNINSSARQSQTRAAADTTFLDDHISPVRSVSAAVDVVASSPSGSNPILSRSRSRKRRTPVSSDEEDHESGENGAERPRKRVNNHDKRVYTIQLAMRKHIYRLMQVDPDDDLPPSHLDGFTIGDDEPVRFNWERTVKQSKHNSEMKARVIADLQANQKLYKHVPSKEFAKNALESTFDQAFTTLRQKFKTQIDASAAAALKAREDNKAMRSRRSSRKKFKLRSRVEVRAKTEAFTHATFNGAMQIDCMSSEESEDEQVEADSSKPKAKKLMVRGIPWRSTRMLRYYGMLDEDDKVEKGLKPKRAPRQDRNEGPPKAGFHMPPKGVASWMVSRRWLRDLQLSHPELVGLLNDIVVDPPGFDWNQFDALGYESEDELDPDLSAVSGQISDLQDRSKDIETRLKSRRKIEKPLSSLLTDLTIPPPMATIILDTSVDETWIPAVENFECRLEVLKARSRVKAARDLGEVAEGLRIVAATKLRAFFMALLQPIKTSMTTNMQRQAPNVAQEVQKAYIGAARTYYETGFRRYMRSLGWIKVRNIEKADTIVAATSTPEKSAEIEIERLGYARIAGPGVTLTYMADDKTYTQDVEALLRSCLLVLMDNGTAEYTFLTKFFATETLPPVPPSATATSFPRTSLSADHPDDTLSASSTEVDALTPRARNRADSVYSTNGTRATANKDSVSSLNVVWKQIMDPALEHAQNFVKASLEPLPPVIPLLTIIRLTEEVMVEIQKRECPPLETFVFGLRLQMWPLFQKAMTDQIDAHKNLAEGAGGGYFRRAVATTDTLVLSTEETMIFSNLLRLRQELTKLVETHTDKLTDARIRAKTRSALYEELLQGLNRGFREAPAHPKAQTEITYWKEKEEQARKAMLTTGRAGAGG
ncbi:hypothetical protein EWM64_g58 [Hericium alpestre]|uniref:Uncharacterized protein n=1 Tax=Hericium alpestre TaxID=135208 RepID=A0A4Z0ABZ5_9AGAM|nr:hypothetical protein EWM64_g58 [Hericium alpestre]